jgi:hypothetical protein
MKLSFDFDSTLSRQDVEQFAQSLVQAGHEVWIVTSRFDDQEILKRFNRQNQNLSLFETAQRCGIPQTQIQFCNMRPKAEFLKGRGFQFHLDDDSIELLDLLDTKDPCQAINVEHSEWLQTCLSIISHDSK